MPAETFSLDTVSVLMIWTAIAIYALAFIAYAIDLSRRSALAVDASGATVRERELVAAGALALRLWFTAAPVFGLHTARWIQTS